MLTYRDSDIPFAGHPTYRLDTNLVNGGSNVPGAQPNTTGIVAKMRIGATSILGPTSIGSSSRIGGGRYGIEFWFRASAGVWSAGVALSCSSYVRDPTNIHIGRIWFNTTNGFAPVSLQYLNSAASYVEMLQYNAGIANFLPSGGVTDRAGNWNYVKLITDFLLDKYVSFQFNDYFVDLSAQSLRVEASVGTIDTAHFSLELNTNNTGQRVVNIGQLVATQE